MKLEIKEIDLTDKTFMDEYAKMCEEDKEFFEALMINGYDNNQERRNHLLEEACDRMYVTLSLLRVIGITTEEIAKYWNTEFANKLEYRPRDVERNE